MNKNTGAVDYSKYAKTKEEICNYVISHMGPTEEASKLIKRLYAYNPDRIGRYVVMMDEIITSDANNNDGGDEEPMEYEEFWSLVEGSSFFELWEDIGEMNYWTDVMEQYGVREVLFQLMDDADKYGWRKK